MNCHEWHMLLCSLSLSLSLSLSPLSLSLSLSLSLRPVFQDLTERQGQRWGLAQCSPELREAAFGVWDDSREALDQIVVERTKEEGEAFG